MNVKKIKATKIKPSSNQKILKLLFQNLCSASVYLPYVYFLPKKLKPEINMYKNAPQLPHTKKSFETGIFSKV